jgi:hypothetical protein
MDDAALTFLNETRSATMTTLRADGTPHTARVCVAGVDGKIWSSGTRDRLRTRHLRRDPRSTLFVFDATFRWLATMVEAHRVTYSFERLACHPSAGQPRTTDH